MALANLHDWNDQKNDSENAAVSACGSGDKPSACGSGDKPSACGSACGAGDK